MKVPEGRPTNNLNRSLKTSTPGDLTVQKLPDEKV
jgi:hypothetical protein